jgi:alkanesulfonate monooxygenase SsuD/methylene tetrahydromethanopterin reductase-like flavin-dependent oxidoreductase (luciferase family)
MASLHDVDGTQRDQCAQTSDCDFLWQDEFYPGYARAVSDVGKERGWRPSTRADFDAQRGTNGAPLIGSADEVADKIIRHSEALGGISRITFQMNASSLPHAKLMQSIEALGTRVAPAVREYLAGR